MASYLVTGGAGFIGSNLVHALLDRGESVRVLDNFSTGRRENLTGVSRPHRPDRGDICDPDTVRRAMEGVDYVLHQAALPSVPRSVENPLESLNVGVMGTAQVLLAARDARVKRVVYAASSSAYGDQQAQFKTETLLPRPLSPYAEAKLSGEHLCAIFTHCYGLETVSLRYFNVFGPRQDPASPYSAVIPRFISAVQRGESPVIYGDGLQTRDFTFVQNNSRRTCWPPRLPKGAGGVQHRLRTSFSLLDLLGAITGARRRCRSSPRTVPGWRRARFPGGHFGGSRDTGYRVSVPFEEGILRTVEWLSTPSGTKINGATWHR
jgi:UDP-glucose 4-epimerase